ncbi:DUF4147 domain-containing protein [Candidatus Kaiserbacteria bacterium]|nr:DUF4147 domain-containing protein [Candidatus Kaiserbacteria bacterium]
MKRIQNVRALATTDARRDALAIAEAGYVAIDVGVAIEHRVRFAHEELHIAEKVYRLYGRRIYFVGVGKCALTAARAVEKLLGDRLAGGIALDVSPLTGHPLSKIETYVGTHPLPSETNKVATERIIEFLSGRREDDFVIFFISGGGSTLLFLPPSGMTNTDESKLFRELTARGAPIQDLNTVRKHISRARGGGLAFAAYPSEVISLIVSDVPSGDLTVVASGPTVLDSSTVEDARKLLAKYDVAFPTSASFIETQKDEKYFKRVTNTLFLSNQDALSAMHDEAVRLEYDVTIVNDRFTGEARSVGRIVAEKLHDSPANTVLLYAGESTVTVSGTSGAGGRNQELALSALQYLNPDELILPLASDGHDNTAHAGAIADATTRANARVHHISADEYMNAHRSYDFFTTTGDALVTGYTGSNVSDLIIALKK